MANLHPSTDSFWYDIQEHLADKLSAIQKEGLGIIGRSEQSIVAARSALRQLRAAADQHAFRNQDEEIYFYKVVKPGFYSTLLFHTAVYKAELGMPPGTKADQEAYLKREIDQAAKFFDDNRFIYQYIRSGQTYLDDRLFLTPKNDAVYAITAISSLDDPACAASFDYLVGRIKATEELQCYLIRAVEDLHKDERSRDINRPALVWTESKTALTELAYALHATGAINNGKTDLKEIVEGLQQLFNVNLGNYPRTFQEILSRKTGYTTFLDKARDKLLLRIQAIEEKYIK